MSNLKIGLKFEADVKQFRTQFQNATKDINSMVGSLKTVGGLMKLYFVREVFAAGKQLFDFVYQMGKAADGLLDLRDQTGASLSILQSYRYVAAEAGVSTDFFATSVMELTQKLKDIDVPTSEFSKSLRKLGVDIRDSNGILKPSAQMMEDIMFAMAEQENIMKRNSIGNELFGGSWKDLAPVLGMGADKIRELTNEAKINGVVIGDQSIEAANKARIEFDKLNMVWEAAKIQAGSNLAPTITDILIPAFTKLSSTIDYVLAGRSVEAFVNYQKRMIEAELVAQGFYDTLEKGNTFQKTASELTKIYTAQIADVSAKLKDGTYQGQFYVDWLEQMQKSLAEIKNQRTISVVEGEIAALNDAIKTAHRDELPAINAQLAALKKELAGLSEFIEKPVGAINVLNAEIENLNKKIGTASEDELPAYNAQMQILQERLQKLKELGKIELPEVPASMRGKSLFGEGMYNRAEPERPSMKIEGITEDMFKNIGIGRVEGIPGIMQEASKASFDFAQSFENSMLQIAASNNVAGDSMESFSGRFAKSTIDVVRSLGAQAAAIAVRDSLLKSGLSPILAIAGAAVAVGAVNALIGSVLSGVGGGSAGGAPSTGGSRGYTETQASRRFAEGRDRMQIRMHAKLTGQVINFSNNKYTTQNAYNN